jgi:hypothetical protein
MYLLRGARVDEAGVRFGWAVTGCCSGSAGCASGGSALTGGTLTVARTAGRAEALFAVVFAISDVVDLGGVANASGATDLAATAVTVEDTLPAPRPV